MASFRTSGSLLGSAPFRLLLAVVGLWAGGGCAKIGSFDEPYMSEVFMGNCTITPSVKGISSAAFTVCTVGVSGDASGKNVTIHGIPDIEPFPVIPEKIFNMLSESSLVPTFPPTISGFAAEVVDKKTLKVTGFASMSDTAEELGLEATGTVFRQGPQIATSKDDPIVIHVKVRPLRQMIPEIVLENITQISDGTPISEFSDEEMLPLYRIDFRPEIVTVF